MIRTLATVAFALSILSMSIVAGAAAFQTNSLPAQISDQEFWRLVTEFSEPSGDYPYQNFVSNEITLQRIIPPTKQMARISVWGRNKTSRMSLH